MGMLRVGINGEPFSCLVPGIQAPSLQGLLQNLCELASSCPCAMQHHCFTCCTHHIKYGGDMYRAPTQELNAQPRLCFWRGHIRLLICGAAPNST